MLVQTHGPDANMRREAGCGSTGLRVRGHKAAVLTFPSPWRGKNLDYGYEDGRSSAHFAIILKPISFFSCAVHSWVELKA
jgi:hypothetical protein